MNVASIIVVFSLVWWLVFFMSLPIGVRQVEKPEEGHDPGAPENPHLLPKLFWSTMIALIVTLLIVTLLNMGMFEGLLQEAP